MVTAPYGYCFKLFDFFRSCKILFGLVKFKTAPDRMSGNVWEVFVNTVLQKRQKQYTPYILPIPGVYLICITTIGSAKANHVIFNKSIKFTITTHI